jgi:hypothetical protein
VGGPHTISATDPVSSSEAPRLEFKSNNADPGRIGTLISALANGATLVDRPYMEGGEAAFKLRKRSMDSDPILRARENVREDQIALLLDLIGRVA